MSQLYMLDISRSTVPWCLWLSSNISLYMYIFVYKLTLEFCWEHEVECSMEHIHKHRPLVTLADIQCFIHKSKYTIHLVQTKICSTRHRRPWHGLTTPFFSNFLFTNLFSIKFLYFFIISSLFPYFSLFVSIFIQFYVNIKLHVSTLYRY